MPVHRNPTITEDAARILNSKANDFLPAEVSGPVAVIPIVRFNNIARTIATTGANAVIYTTPSDKDFYLTAACLSHVQDVACTNTLAALQVVIEGSNRELLAHNFLTLTACGPITISNSFPGGIRLDRNTNITLTHAAATATQASRLCIQGYTVETTKGV